MPTVVHDLLLLGPEETIDPRTVRADLDFAAKSSGTARAVDVEGNLEEPRGTNPILRKMARGIIANQRFEIAMLTS